MPVVEGCVVDETVRRLTLASKSKPTNSQMKTKPEVDSSFSNRMVTTVANIGSGRLRIMSCINLPSKGLPSVKPPTIDANIAAKNKEELNDGAESTTNLPSAVNARTDMKASNQAIMNLLGLERIVIFQSPSWSPIAVNEAYTA